MADELLANYQHIIEELTLITSSGGAYEVKVNGDLIYSKLSKQKRHAEPGEVYSLFEEMIGPDTSTFA